MTSLFFLPFQLPALYLLTFQYSEKTAPHASIHPSQFLGNLWRHALLICRVLRCLSYFKLALCMTDDGNSSSGYKALKERAWNLVWIWHESKYKESKGNARYQRNANHKKRQCWNRPRSRNIWGVKLPRMPEVTTRWKWQRKSSVKRWELMRSD